MSGGKLGSRPPHAAIGRGLGFHFEKGTRSGIVEIRLKTTFVSDVLFDLFSNMI